MTDLELLKQNIQKLLDQMDTIKAVFKKEFENDPRYREIASELKQAHPFLEDAMYCTDEAITQDEESRPTKAEYKDYLREESATTDKEI